MSALDEQIAHFARSSVADLLNGDGLSTPDWVRLRNLQLSGGMGGNAIEAAEGGAVGTSADPRANEDYDGLPLRYNPNTGRFTVTNGSEIASNDPTASSEEPAGYEPDPGGFFSGATFADDNAYRAPPVTPVTIDDLAPAFLRLGSFSSDYARGATPGVDFSTTPDTFQAPDGRYYRLASPADRTLTNMLDRGEAHSAIAPWDLIVPGAALRFAATGAEALAKVGAEEAGVDAAEAAESGSRIDRSAFAAKREAYWRNEAEVNADAYSESNLARMRAKRAPIGNDGYSMELHHVDGTDVGELQPMTRTDHRLGKNYKENHPWVEE